MEEKDILSLYLTRDERAVTESGLRYGYACTRLAQHILDNSTDAEACVRDALSVAWESIPPHSPTSLEAYLLKATRRLALERYHANQSAKRGYRLFATVLDELSECAPRGSASLGGGFFPEEEAAQTGECLGRFLRKQRGEVRDLFLCRYFYGDSLGEMARRFGLSEKRVHILLRRTRKRLRKMLEAEPTRSWSPDRETLAAGLGHVDDAMILSAHGARKKARRLIPWLGAACVVAAVAVSFPFLREVINTDLVLRQPDWKKEQENPDKEMAEKPDAEAILDKNTAASVGGSTVTVTDVTDTTVTLLLVKTDSTPIYAAVYDRMGDALACTQPDYKADGVTIRSHTLKLRVDGTDEILYEFPTEAGSYTVVLDFSRIRNGQYPMEDYAGFFSYTGKDGAPEAMYFSILTDLPEADTADILPTDTEKTP